MKKILRSAAYLVILLLIAGFISALEILQNLNWLIGLAIFCTIIGIWLAIVFIRRFLVKKRMKDFVNKVVQQQPVPILVENSPVTSIGSLRKNWKDSLVLLKSSKNGRKLPWFLVLGGKDSGKTSAIRYAKLNTAFSKSNKTKLLETENCDWWFLEKSIVLDTSSRYVDPINEDNDLIEWKELLHNFAKYNGRKPLNGIIITVSAKHLLNNDYISLRDEGLIYRKKIDNLMKVCWARFPIYIMITKMDELYGFSETFLKFNESETEQAAGYLNVNDLDYTKVVDRFMHLMISKLREIRSDLFANHSKSLEPGLIIFPKEFATLKRGLDEFTKAVFETNPYQEDLIFRGIYFSSAKQDSVSHSSLIKYENEYLKSQVPENEVRGVFLRDFFDKIIVSDKNLVTPAYSFYKWRFIAQSIGVLSVLFIFLALFSVYTANYLHNKNTLDNFLSDFSTPPKVSNDLYTNLVSIDKLRKKIVELEDADKNWYLPSLGITSTASLIPKLKSQYSDLYRDGYINIYNQLYNTSVDQFSPSTESTTVMAYLDIELEKVKFIEYTLDHKKSDPVPSIQDLARAYYQVMLGLNQQRTDIIANLAAENYSFNLKLLKEKNVLLNERRYVLYMVKKIVGKFPHDQLLQNMDQSGAITLNDFWGDLNTTSADTDKPLVAIPSVFTKNGMKRIEYFIQLMKQENMITSEDDHEIAEFWAAYRTQYFNYWEQFTKNFSAGEELISSASERKNTAKAMVTDKNPYYEYIHTAALELAPDEHLTDPPDWVNLLIQLDQIHDNARASINKAGIKQNIFHKIQTIVPKDAIATQSAELDKEVSVISMLNDYHTEVSKSWVDLPSDNAYFEYVGNLFSEYNGKAEQKSSIIKAVTTANNLKEILESNVEDDNIVWPLEVGPLNYILDYYMDKTSCAIQSKWDSEILEPISDTPSDKIYQVLLSSNGLLPKFLSENVTLFLNLVAGGYTSKLIYDGTDFENKIDFDKDFISFLDTSQPNLSSAQSSYMVKIDSVPTTLNPEATVIPYGTTLTVECSDGEQILQNYNSPSSMTVSWLPDKCADTTLKILFPNFTLTKTYNGPLGFPHFLEDFKAGSHKFTSGDFPLDADILRNSYKVDWIQIKYNIKNSASVINLSKTQGSLVPDNITDCDDSGLSTKK